MTKRDIEKAKEKSLVELLDSLDIPYQNASDHVKIICPFHDEYNASLAIYEDYYYCYACGKNGDNINFVMDAFKKTFKEAVEILLKL